MSADSQPRRDTVQPGAATEGGGEICSACPAVAGKPFTMPDNIAGELARFLETQIIYGVLPPGARLIEEDIVSRHNISRSPVREAFRALENTGMAVRSPRRGIRVSDMSLNDVNDLYPPRLLLKGQAAENAAIGRSGAQLDAIRHACEALQSHENDADTRQFFIASLEFSEATGAACGSRTLRRLLDHLDKQAMRYRYQTYRHNRAMVRLTAASAVTITEAIARRDPVVAKSATLIVLEQSRDLLRQIFAVSQEQTHGTPKIIV